MDPMRFLETESELERFVMQVIAKKYVEISDRQDRNRAVLIANAVAKAFGGS